MCNYSIALKSFTEGFSEQACSTSIPLSDFSGTVRKLLTIQESFLINGALRMVQFNQKASTLDFSLEPELASAFQR